MALASVSLSRNQPNRWPIAAAGLGFAAILVGIAIALDGPVVRVVNGIGAVLWVASGVLLAFSLPTAKRPPLGWLLALASGLLLGAVVRPATLAEAVVWFGIAGAVVALAAGDRLGAWALLVPAVYLPVHLAIGIGRAILRGGAIRTDAPPTAEILPLAMILAAAAGGAIAAAVVRRTG
jgi:hypothetical protein